MYLAVALQPAPRTEGGEIFPFFNWSLFTNSSPESSDTVALIHAVNGEQFDQPRFLYDMPEEFVTAAQRDIRMAKVLDRYAIAHLTGQTENAEGARALIEDHFMRGARDVDYSIAVVRFDSVGRYRTGAFHTVHELGRFRKP
ncbi:MAG: hypothetical protein AAGH57_04675 [Pseudomonadota bacterium]